MINLNNKNWNCFTIYQYNSTFEYLSWKEGMRRVILSSPPRPFPSYFPYYMWLKMRCTFFDVQQICWYQLHGYVRTCAFGRLWVSACDYASVCFYVCMFVSQVHQNVMTFSGIVRNVYKNHKDQRHKHIKKKYR